MESIFSLDDEATPDTILALDQESLSDDKINDFYKVSPLSKLAHSIPLALVIMILYKYSKPFKVIAMFDTGAYKSILDPRVLRPTYWVHHKEYFLAADN